MMFYHRFIMPPWVLLLGWALIVKATTTIYSDCQAPTQDPLTGNYIEQLNVTRSGPLTILGQTSKPSSQKANTVTVYWAAANFACKSNKTKMTQ